MSFQADIDPNAAAAAEEAASGGDGSFPPLPKGRYQAIVKENKGVEPFTKKQDNANFGKNTVSLAVQILDESPTGAKRYYFVRVPLFSRYAPTEKNPQGAPARMFWDFFEKVMGISRADVIAGKLSDNVGGKRLTIVLGDPKKPDDFNPLGSNEVAFVDAPDADFARTPVRAPGVSAAPWLTPDDVLIPDHPSLGTPGGAPGATGLPQPAWGQPAVPAAGTTAPLPANVTQGAWGQLPAAAADPSLQQAAMAGGKTF